jgi:hypothetical protein
MGGGLSGLLFNIQKYELHGDDSELLKSNISDKENINGMTSIYHLWIWVQQKT